MTPKTFFTLTALKDGSPAKKSDIPVSVLDDLISGGIVDLFRSGRSWNIRCLSPSLLEGYMKRAVRTDDLDAYAGMLQRRGRGEEISRAETARVTGNTKTFRKPVMHGLRINVTEPTAVTYDGMAMRIEPVRGTCIEFAEPRKLAVDKGITIVGVENFETFMYIKDYKHLFKERNGYLFTYRDTSGKKAYERMAEWLTSIPNRYLHFGDLDIYGINVFLDEFKKRLGERASFFIPENYEELIKKGNRELYDKQTGLRVPDIEKEPELLKLLNTIRKYKRVFEQEPL